MRNAWLAAALVVLILVLSFAVNRTVTDTVEHMLVHLDECEQLADNGDFKGAQLALMSAFALWEDRAPLFAVAVPAHHTNEINTAMHGLREQLACQDYKTYKSVNAQLAATLQEMAKGIRVSWENVM